MSFAIRPLAPAFLISLLTSIRVCVNAVAAPLQPYQQDALNKMLAMLSESQVQQMMASFANKRSAAAEAPGPTPASPPAAVTPEDLAFNRAQYEPAIRRAWESAHAYDEFVRAKLGAYCPPQGTYAVFGAAWRYEVVPPSPNWPTASNGADLDVQVLGQSYAPQDGRYHLDFSKVRSTFDKTAVEQAIKTACAKYVEIGTAFVAEARAHIVKDYLPDGPKLEQAANAKMAPAAKQLEETVKAQAPGSDYALFTALQNA